MRISASGGGFFFSPFTMVEQLGPYTIIPAIGAFGGWAHTLNPLTIKARWIEIGMRTAGAAVGVYTFQIALGPVAGETLFLPTIQAGYGENSFIIQQNGDYITNPYLYDISFPITIPQGAELSFRAAQSLGPAVNLLAYVVLFG